MVNMNRHKQNFWVFESGIIYRIIVMFEPLNVVLILTAFHDKAYLPNLCQPLL